jgi:putative oxidoreductase
MSVPPFVAVIARVLMALMFILAGLSKFGALSGTAGYIASKGLPVPMVLAILTGTLETVGGLALVVGFQARIVGLALALFTLLASVIFHNFWAMTADQQFVQQLMFMKNLSVAGGLLLVFVMGPGPLSLDARRQAAA